VAALVEDGVGHDRKPFHRTHPTRCQGEGAVVFDVKHLDDRNAARLAPSISLCRLRWNAGASASLQYGRWRNDSWASTTSSAVPEKDMVEFLMDAALCHDSEHIMRPALCIRAP